MSNYRCGLLNCSFDSDICLLGPLGSFEVYYFGYGIADFTATHFNTISDKVTDYYCHSADNPASTPA
jgi:hypothetical protein